MVSIRTPVVIDQMDSVCVWNENLPKYTTTVNVCTWHWRRLLILVIMTFTWSRLLFVVSV